MSAPDRIQKTENSPSGAPRPKEWRAGTLRYSAVGLAVLFGWLLFGDFALQLKDRSDMVTAQLVLRKLEASNFLVGLIIGSIPAAIGMIVGPYFSVKSDRHRGPWGRRIPFLLGPLPIVVLSLFGLAVSPMLGGWLNEALGSQSPGRTACILAVFTMFWVSFEFSSAIIITLYGALINDVVPQAVIGRFFGYFRMVSLGAGILFNLVIIKHAEEHFFWIFVGTGLFYGIGFTVMCLMVKEGEYPPPAAREAASGWSRTEAIRTYFKECFATPYYLWIFLAVVLCGLSFSPLNSFSIFYAKSLGLSDELYGRYVAASFIVSFCLAYLLGSLADRFHPLRLGIASMILYICVSIFGAIYGTTADNFGFAFLAHTIISGAYFTSIASIGQRLYPQLKFAQFASGASLLGALCGMMLPPLIGLTLDASGHNYRLTFVAGGILATAGLISLTVVHSLWLKNGGLANYQPPDPR